mmetsp:Transcript_64870/g.102154  ORF Transcript_64870/g.102154 Transcript_64870/m.102154 type:complete len:713 (-) Transcript_64870:188-2326(-)
MPPRRRPASYGGQLAQDRNGMNAWELQGAEVWSEPEVQTLNSRKQFLNDVADDGLPIQARVNVLDVLEINCERGQFTAIFELVFSWTDPTFTELNDELREFMKREQIRPFVKFSIVNQASVLEELGARRVDLLEISQAGASFSASSKYRCSFSDQMGVREFPFDRQLLSMKLVAETDALKFQLVPQCYAGGTATMRQERQWKLCDEMQTNCTMYVLPRTLSSVLAPSTSTQSHSIQVPFHVLLHVERKMDISLYGIACMFFFSDTAAIVAFCLPFSTMRDRLWLLLVSAVLLSTYWYVHVFFGRFPHLDHMTLLDRYVSLSLCFKALLVVESLIVALLLHNNDTDSDVGRHDTEFAAIVFGSWIAMHGFALVLLSCRSCRCSKYCVRRGYSKASKTREEHRHCMYTPWWKLYEEKGESAWSDKPRDNLLNSSRDYCGWEPGGMSFSGPLVAPLDQHAQTKLPRFTEDAFSTARAPEVVAPVKNVTHHQVVLEPVEAEVEERWKCLACGEVNKPSRSECNNCRQRRPEALHIEVETRSHPSTVLRHTPPSSSGDAQQFIDATFSCPQSMQISGQATLVERNPFKSPQSTQPAQSVQDLSPIRVSASKQSPFDFASPSLTPLEALCQSNDSPGHVRVKSDVVKQVTFTGLPASSSGQDPRDIDPQRKADKSPTSCKSRDSLSASQGTVLPQEPFGPCGWSGTRLSSAPTSKSEK